MLFNTLEIQQKIEEKRLILGARFENFLLKNLARFGLVLRQILHKLFAKKYFVFASCLTIILLGIFTQSSRDIGHDSGAYIEMAQKILAGGKYYHDFFENNFPFTLYLTAIPVFFADAFTISPAIALQLFVNLIGVASIYFCAKILCSPSATAPISASLKKLIIISFCFVYFIRIYTLQFNEYGTKSSYFLALALPYICCHLTINNLSRIFQIATGTLAGLIICLKPHYAILIAALEIYAITKTHLTHSSTKPPLIHPPTKPYRRGRPLCRTAAQRIFQFIFVSARADTVVGPHNRNVVLRNLAALGIITLYLTLIKTFTPEYFTYLSQFSALYFSIDHLNYFTTFKEDLFPILIFITATFSIIKNNTTLKILLCATLACAAITASELIGEYDQRSIFFTFALPLVFITSIYFCRKNLLDATPAALVILAKAEVQLTKKQQLITTSNIILALLCLIIPQFDAKNIFPFLLNLCCFWWIILFFFKKPNWPLIVLALASIIISLFDYSEKISWIFCAIIFLFLLQKYQKTSPKFLLIIISLTWSYLASLTLASIFNHQYLYASFFKSPNYVNEEKINIIKKYAPQKSDNVTIISDKIAATYPVFTYLDKHNLHPANNLYSLYPATKKQNGRKAADYLFSRLLEQISDENNKLIFVKEHLNGGRTCMVSFIEYYLRDENFRNIFLQNYQFLNRIIYTKNQDDKTFIIEDIEVYIRK